MKYTQAERLAAAEASRARREARAEAERRLGCLRLARSMAAFFGEMPTVQEWDRLRPAGAERSEWVIAQWGGWKEFLDEVYMKGGHE